MHTQPTILRRPKHYRRLRSDPSSPSMPGKKYDHPDSFLSALAHEVRNPLCTINLAVQMLNLGSLDDDQRQFVDIIMRGSCRIKELIDHLLVPNRADETVFECYSTAHLLEEALFVTKDRLLLKNITVTRLYTASECKVRVDKEKMKIALINIIVNAVDAMPPQGGELKLVTKLAGARNIVEIRDNGMGIKKEFLKSIFKPYFTNKQGGMGLGLAVTLDILQTNHAAVDVQSEEGAGTCFLISFDSQQ